MLKDGRAEYDGTEQKYQQQMEESKARQEAAQKRINEAKNTKKQ